MKKSILLVFSVLFSFINLLDAQSIKHRTYKATRSYFKYSYYCNTDSAEAVLIAIRDGDPNWTPDKLCEDLAHIADDHHWIVIVPNSPMTSDRFSDDVYLLLNSYQKDRKKKKKVYLFTIGTGVQSWLYSQLVKLPAVFINPINIGEAKGRIPMNLDIPLAVITSGDNYEGKVFSDTLFHFGGWVYFDHNQSAEKYYMPNHIDVFDRALTWVDSMNTILIDPTAKRSMYGLSGVLNTIPETVRQGNNIPINLWITTATDYTIRVEDLTGAILWSKEMFLHKGMHDTVVPTKDLPWGVYEIVVDGKNLKKGYKFIVKG